MTVAQYITFLRVLINDTSTTNPNWPDADLIPCADGTQAEAVALMPEECLTELAAVETLTVTAASSSETAATVDLSTLTAPLYIRSVRLRATTATPYYRADERRIDDLWEYGVPGTGKTATAQRPVYAMHGTKLWAYPGVLTGANSAQIFTTKRPTRLTAVGDSFQVNEAYQRILVWGGAALALNKFGQVEQSTAADAAFRARIAELWLRRADQSTQMPRHVAERLYGSQAK